MASRTTLEKAKHALKQGSAAEWSGEILGYLALVIIAIAFVVIWS